MLKNFLNLNRLNFSSVDLCVLSFFEKKISRVIDSFCVSKVGRVESVHLSPNLNQIGYSSFDLNKILIFNIIIEKNKINVKDCFFIGCEFESPHDFAWIDDSHIVIANRNGSPSICTVDSNSTNQIHLKEIPNSNSVISIKKNNLFELIFCGVDNQIYSYKLDENFNRISFSKIINYKFNIPDGIAVNSNKTLLAITNALENEIIIYNIEQKKIIRKIKEVKHPHSVDFLNENILFSTGGGDPFVYCWDLNNFNKMRIKILNQKEFELRGSDKEGGIKGICSCKELNLLFLTCPNSPFLIFDIKNLCQSMLR